MAYHWKYTKPEPAAGASGSSATNGKSTNKRMAVHPLFCASTLQQIAPLLEAFSKPAEAAHYRQLAKNLKHVTKAQCYDKGRKLFSDTPDKRFFSQHANTLAVLTIAWSRANSGNCSVESPKIPALRH